MIGQCCLLHRPNDVSCYLLVAVFPYHYFSTPDAPITLLFVTVTRSASDLLVRCLWTQSAVCAVTPGVPGCDKYVLFLSVICYDYCFRSFPANTYGFYRFQPLQNAVLCHST